MSFYNNIMISQLPMSQWLVSLLVQSHCLNQCQLHLWTPQKCIQINFCLNLKYLHLPKPVCIISTIFFKDQWVAIIGLVNILDVMGRKYNQEKWPMVYKGKTLQLKYIDGLVHDCSNSSALETELQQSCAEPSLYNKISNKYILTHCILDVGKLVIIASCNGFDIIWGHRFEADKLPVFISVDSNICTLAGSFARDHLSGYKIDTKQLCLMSATWCTCCM